MSGLHEYERLLGPARERFAASYCVRALESRKDDSFLESFLLHYCAFGVGMTKPVEGWIRRAGERCADLGHAELARMLIAHAQAESRHDLMMIEDVRSLAAHWNARRAPLVNPDELLNEAPTPGVRRYCKLHEDNIASDTPYGQIAIEYEVEMLSVRYGELFATRCIEVLGVDILSCLSFLRKHIELDVGHTNLNRQAITGLIEKIPSSIPALVSAGSSALDAYGAFLSDCVQRAELHSRQARPASTASKSLTWQVHGPIQSRGDGVSRDVPDWLYQVRSLRGSVLFDSGRRPGFRMHDGSLLDSDPVDLYSYHLLAYDGATLAGCVRLYPLVLDGPACVTERMLGDRAFSEMLSNLHVRRAVTIEIGRWIVHPAYRSTGRVSTQLAAGSGALAMTLEKSFAPERGIVVCAAGTCDHQDAILARLGLKDITPTALPSCDEFNDCVRIMYALGVGQLNPRFKIIMKEMAKAIGVAQPSLEM